MSARAWARERRGRASRAQRSRAARLAASEARVRRQPRAADGRRVAAAHGRHRPQERAGAGLRRLLGRGHPRGRAARSASPRGARPGCLRADRGAGLRRSRRRGVGGGADCEWPPAGRQAAGARLRAATPQVADYRVCRCCAAWPALPRPCWWSAQVKLRMPQAELPLEGGRVAAGAGHRLSPPPSTVRSLGPKSTIAQETGAALAAFVPAVLSLRNSTISGYHGAEHKVIAGREAEMRAAAAGVPYVRGARHAFGRCRRSQGARPLRLQPRRPAAPHHHRGQRAHPGQVGPHDAGRLGRGRRRQPGRRAGSSALGHPARRLAGRPACSCRRGRSSRRRSPPPSPRRNSSKWPSGP